MEFHNKIHSNPKKLFYILATLSTGFLFNPILKADQIANSSIDLKKDIENIKQKSFKNPKNLESPINESIDKKGSIPKRTSEKTILLKSIILSGNKQYSDEKLINLFEGLLNKEVTFSDLYNAVLNVQTLYRENGFITTRAILPKQNFIKGNIKVAINRIY